MDLFDDNRPLHVVVPGSADNVAFHVEFALVTGCDLKSGWLARLDRLVDIERLHAKAVLDIGG